VKNSKTIDSVIEDDLCTGCGTCVGLCPLSAIEMVKNEPKGVYIPQLDKDRCNGCGICFEICPGHTVDFKQLNLEIFGKQPYDILLGNYLNCYVGHAIDYDIRYNSASGGLVTALLIFALEQRIIDGALVTKMSEDNPLEPQTFIARTREGIISASKSKYCPVPANIALKEILEQGGKFAVVGLPCHIHGIRKAEALNKKLKEKIVLHIGIFCSHTDSFLGTKFVLHKYGINEEDVAQLDYRGKGWPGHMVMHLKNGTNKIIPHDDFTVFHNLNFFTPKRCGLCCDGNNDFADVSCGDAWLPELMSDKIGTSVIISRNRVGESLLRLAMSSSKLALQDMDIRRVIATMSMKNQYRLRAQLACFTGKKRPLYNIELPRTKLILHPFLLLLLFNSILQRHCLWWLITPLTRIEQAVIALASKLVKYMS